jgi:hypothetical protein
MNRQLPMTLLALALCGAWGSAHSTESALHNDMDGDGRSDLIWGNASTGAIVYWSGARRASAKTMSNGDGKWDLAWRNFATGANVIWKSANAATRQAVPTVPLAWSAGDVRHALPPHGRHPGI